MKEKPILFTGETVRAILRGQKTQTRRVIKPQPVGADDAEALESIANGKPGWASQTTLPYHVGDVLWVKETFADTVSVDWRRPISYRADWSVDDDMSRDFNWKPSIFMPKAYSRIRLEVTKVRVEMLWDISESDAKSEGCGECQHGIVDDKGNNYRGAYQNLWESINRNRYPWASNPWVWVVEFKRL